MTTPAPADHTTLPTTADRPTAHPDGLPADGARHWATGVLIELHIVLNRAGSPWASGRLHVQAHPWRDLPPGIDPAAQHAAGRVLTVRVFPQTWAEVQDVLRVGEPVELRGRIDRRDSTGSSWPGHLTPGPAGPELIVASAVRP